jgi:hypothetical protein
MAALSVGCGGGSTPLDGNPGGPPAQHVPQALTCSAHGDGGVACTETTACQAVNPSQGLDVYCFEGQCGPDECLSDTDCSGTAVCSCAGQTRGYAGASPGNVCVPANCQTDADCGAGGYCSPTVDSQCGSFYGVQGYYCHKPGDACTSDADCGGDGGLGMPYCAYSPMTGAWACGTGACAG